jgi:hypothetical protein
LWPPGRVRRQYDQGEWTQWRGGAHLVEAAVRVVPFKGWVKHVASVIDKLDAIGRTDAVAHAARLGIIEL